MGAILAISSASPDYDGTCHSFAGGSVFPEGNKAGDHGLQLTKAVSKWILYYYKTFLFLLNLC